ncbi:hypothetical protein AURDEDRAFT_171234 [Auricularia subglabra TFB-10046 SS5]|uniref:Uncharacterized protein n=1 Tax=Auricularia subglabra (strain TFB-10046 / SS5) TaxID=717982 RepID=J0WXS1_AURST|nr:hypothetical protein AURDEDRAFT_171234 [Auricularia subglabra TFB-10046 SS5]
MEVPLRALNEFRPVCAALPALTHLTIAIAAQQRVSGKEGSHTFAWHRLCGLDSLAKDCQRLGTICLVVECPSSHCPPTADLLPQLATFDGIELPNIEIKGFFQYITHDIDIPELCGSVIIFK